MGLPSPARWSPWSRCAVIGDGFEPARANKSFHLPVLESIHMSIDRRNFLRMSANTTAAAAAMAALPLSI